MKISNETKVGAITAISVALLILGFNFLKGKKLWSTATILTGKYGNVQGLQNSNAIIINGLQVGTVYKITTEKDMREILGDMNITKDIEIPKNSIAIIKSNPLGTTSIEIKLGDATENLKNKDIILTETSGGIFDDVLKKVDPVLYEVRKAVTSVDTLLGNFNSILDPNAKGNISEVLANLNKVTASMVTSTASLNGLLNSQTGALAKSLNNVSAITGNFANNNEKINNVMSNLDKTTAKFADLNVKKTLDTLDRAVNDLKNIIGKFDNNNGTLGKLMNDPTLYKNLASSGNKLNLLLDDIRVNPKRYINVSVFGKKQNNNPLLVPMPDTLNSPYYIEKVN
ncbi:MAG: MlaD family protein [Ferruginibacter sp.]|nr:MlaD family protein [Ferruginibacter sp.]